ncbi:MAG: nucleoid-associated protein [Sphingobacteriaceae bacterium]|nr:nucleoid-associated protein [Sphingobacteriaceae bacterium]
MIEFTRAELTHFAVHIVGNNGLGEEMVLSENLFEAKDDFIKETLFRYFTGPFKTDIYYQFKKTHDINLNPVMEVCEEMFSSPKSFLKQSQKAAKHLFKQSTHPKIKGGEFYVAYFKDVLVDAELCDAVGFFKSENKETFLKVFEQNGNVDIACENGIDINKLDKGCLVYNLDSKKGYKMSVIDTNNRNAEIAMYWELDFLNAELKANAYFHTMNFMEASRGFCEEILVESNNVAKQDQMMMLNKATGYFKERDQFKMKDFEKEVLEQPELISAFRDYKKDFNNRFDLTDIEEFEVSPTAVKKNQKYMKSVVKLDKNFHIYIHGRHDYVERGYDEENGLKFYKLYYVNETS